MVKDFFRSIRFAPLHLVFWVLVWLFYVYFFSYTSENSSFVWWFSASILPVTVVTTYVFSYLLIPKYLLPKKYLLFAVYSFYTVVCSLFLILIITFVNFIFISEFDITQMPLLTRNFVFVLIMVYLVVIVLSFIKLLHLTHQATRRNKELENKLLEGKLLLKQKELHYLKQQIHPHFLFNTLNTVYGFALKQSKETPDLILKLSSLLDYILHQIDKPTVLLSEEIKYIEAYMGLEHIRFRDSLQVSFQKEIVKERVVPPMLFMAFVENAFKHGTAIDGILKIDIDLTSKEDKLCFRIKNSVSLLADKVESHGLGLENTKKRLDALFPKAYVLKVDKDESWYQVHLEITHN
ncbi:MAG: sensor histidine kinase [Bacteroidota bacterium]